MSVNAVVPGRSRTKEAIASVRHVFLDVDRDGPRLLREVTLRCDLPSPSYVIHTSPERIHVLWRVHRFDVERVEALQKCLARELGTDSAATACSQMTRLPGFINYKHELPHLVVVDYHASNSVFTPPDFPSPRTAYAENVPAIRTALMVKQVRPDQVGAPRLEHRIAGQPSFVLRCGPFRGPWITRRAEPPCESTFTTSSPTTP